jgi:methyl acetate hydrolase
MRPTREIDRLLLDAVDAGVAPGVVAIAVDREGTRYEGAAGRHTLGGQAPMALDTVLSIASMTKAITGVAVMQLVEQGRLGLDDEVARHRPELADPRVLESFDAEGRPRLRPARSAITLRQLLTHTAGFTYDMWNADMAAYMRNTGLTRRDILSDPAHVQPLSFDPGTRWAYGTGIDWAGKVLEAVTGTTLEAYLAEQVFAPLGMASTGYRLRPDMAPRLSGMHQRHPDGTLTAIPHEPLRDSRDFTGGGGLLGTAADYARFLRLLLGEGALDGTRLLRPETVALMARDHIAPLAVEPMRTARPTLSNDLELFPEQRKGWGLTFLTVTRDVPGRRRAGSLAWAGLRNTYYWVDPASGVAGLLMTQMLPFADPAVLSLLERFEAAVYDGA